MERERARYFERLGRFGCEFLSSVALTVALHLDELAP
jgi:hypothetical protein